MSNVLILGASGQIGRHASQQRSQPVRRGIHKNGKHEIGKIGTNAVVAEVSNDKVIGMSAGNLPVKRFKSSKKMAGLNGDKLQVAANGALQLAQMDPSYYAYCFDIGVDFECYWYPATDVVVTGPVVALPVMIGNACNPWQQTTAAGCGTVSFM